MNQSLDAGKQGSKPSAEVLNDGLELGGFSCAELARFRIPGFPATEQGWGKVVAREDWPWKEIQAKGGRKGVKRIYMPPIPLLEVIRRHLLGDEVTKHEVAAARVRLSLNQTQAPGTLDVKGNYLLGQPSQGLTSMRQPSPFADEELMISMGEALTVAGFLPPSLDGEQRRALAIAATRAICAITPDPALRAAAAREPDTLQAALELAWLVAHRPPKR